MKKGLSLQNVLVLATLITSLHSMAQSFGMETQLDPEGGFGRPIRIQNGGIDIQNILLKNKEFTIEPAFEFVKTSVTYNVTLSSQNPNPPSCQVISQRLRNSDVRRSETEYYINKMNKGELLTLQELQSLKTIQREFLAGVVDPIDQQVRFDIVWKFYDSRDKYMAPIFYLPSPGNDFSQFIVSGPGLSWDNSEGLGIPDFLTIDIAHDFYLSYSMSILDFCFGENKITVIGKNPHPFSDEDPVLSATWKADLLNRFQTGSWETKRREEVHEIKWKLQHGH